MATTRPRHVVITGGSRGIGLAIAQLFAKNAYRCTLISRSEDDLKAAVATLQPLPSSPSSDAAPPPPSTSTPTPDADPFDTFDTSVTPEASSTPSPAPAPASPPPAHAYIPGNITGGPQFWTLNASKPSFFGRHLPKPDARDANHASRIDVLVNCAGIAQKKLFAATDESYTEKVVATNLTSMMVGTRFLVRHGYLRGGARRPLPPETNPVIINISSLLGVSGGYGAVAYAASKAGVLGFTRALATEYVSHRVRVNAIVPGYVESAMTRDLNVSAMEQRIPLGRFGTPEEIAQAALFLADNQYAHNCVLNLDGGLSAV